MSDKITGLAFKPIYDAVLQSTGNDTAETWLEKAGIKTADLGSEFSLFSADTYYLAWGIAEEVTELNELLVSMDEVYTAESLG